MSTGNLMDTITVFITDYAFKILAALIILIVGRWLAKKLANLVSQLLEQREYADKTLTTFLHNIVYYALLVMVFLAAANQLGVSITSFLTIVGAAGLAVGLALKDSLANFASGIMLILFRPYKIGDVVNVAETDGTVERIDIFNTVLSTPDNQKIIVPNAQITSGIIKNVTANDTRRIDLVMGIGYHDDIDKAKQILTELMHADDRILSDPAPVVALAELADSSVNFAVRPWVKTEDYWKVRSDLIEKMKKAFDAAEIGIPYPQQDVHLFVEKK
jgi:small conductance mechanosensitive channel